MRNVQGYRVGDVEVVVPEKKHYTKADRRKAEEEIERGLAQYRWEVGEFGKPLAGVGGTLRRA